MEGSLSAFFIRQGVHLPPVPLPRTSQDASKSTPGATFVVGSSAECDLALSEAGLDQRHLSFSWDWKYSTWVVENLSSSALMVESRSLNQGQSLPLLSWETTLETEGIVFKLHRTPDAPTFGDRVASHVPLTSAGLMIGRGDKNKDGGNMPRLGLDPAMLAIGRSQAEIRLEKGDYILVNHNPSGVGRTILNGDQNFDSRKLVLGDCIQIPNCEYYTFKFTGESLRHLGQGGALKGLDLNVDVGAGRILHTVNVELRKGGFMGIIGGSGQGKSTLMNSLCGIVPATGGGVFVDGVPLRSPRDVARAGIAYVPQDDIVHKELTVDDALYYAARLRLNATPLQVKELIETTMDTLRLTEHRHKRIVNLSGGQRKRVSIASELLVGPDYVFLDEPTSGLDPQTEKSLMGELSLLARHKRIGVACTTHVLQNCHVLTQIAFISRGRLIFHGKPVDAVRFFILAGSPEGAAKIRGANGGASGGHRGASDSTLALPVFGEDGQEFTEADLLNKVANIYDIAQDTTKPVPEQDQQAEGWQREYQASAYYQPPAPEPPGGTHLLPTLSKGVNAIRSLGLLVSRQWKILSSSSLNYLFLAAQAVVIGLLIAWVDENLVLQMFLSLIATLWFGCSNGAQQIVSELAIYRRERLAGLSIHTYVISKFVFLLAITGVQAVMLYAMILIFSPIFHRETKPDLEEAVKDYTGTVPNKATREFRMEFFDNGNWNTLATGEDNTNKNASASAAPPAAGDAAAPSSNSALDFDVVTAPGVKDSPAAPATVAAPSYLNPTGLHVTDFQYRLLEKLAAFFRVRENVLDRLKLRPQTDPSFAELASGTVSWKGFMFDLIALRFGALLGAALVGVALGLAVSALVNTPTQSVMWVPLILIPQILFGSFVVIIPEMNDAVLRFSEALPSFNLERIMDVGLIYGRATPRMTNQTKIPAFIDSPDKQEVVEWDGKQTRYDRVSEVNKSWQNLIVLRDVLGAREKKLGVSGDPKDSVEERADVRLAKGNTYASLGPAETSALVLAGWAIGCYGIAVFALYRRQTGK